MEWKKEVYRIVGTIFALGFFVLCYFAGQTGRIDLFGLGIVSLFIAVILLFYGKRKGLWTKDMEKREKWTGKAMPFFIWVCYGIVAALLVFGWGLYWITGIIEPAIGLTVLAIILLILFGFIHYSIKKEKIKNKQV